MANGWGTPLGSRSRIPYFLVIFQKTHGLDAWEYSVEGGGAPYNLGPCKDSIGGRPSQDHRKLNQNNGF